MKKILFVLLLCGLISGCENYIPSISFSSSNSSDILSPIISVSSGKMGFDLGNGMILDQTSGIRPSIMFHLDRDF